MKNSNEWKKNGITTRTEQFGSISSSWSSAILFFIPSEYFCAFAKEKHVVSGEKKVADSIQIHFFDDRQLSVQEWKDLWTSNPFFPQKMVGVCSNVPTTVFIVRDTFIIYLSLFPKIYNKKKNFYIFMNIICAARHIILCVGAICGFWPLPIFLPILLLLLLFRWRTSLDYKERDSRDSRRSSSSVFIHASSDGRTALNSCFPYFALMDENKQR